MLNIVDERCCHANLLGQSKLRKLLVCSSSAQVHCKERLDIAFVWHHSSYGDTSILLVANYLDKGPTACNAYAIG